MKHQTLTELAADIALCAYTSKTDYSDRCDVLDELADAYGKDYKNVLKVACGEHPSLRKRALLRAEDTCCYAAWRVEIEQQAARNIVWELSQRELDKLC